MGGGHRGPGAMRRKGSDRNSATGFPGKELKVKNTWSERKEEKRRGREEEKGKMVEAGRREGGACSHLVRTGK